MLVACNTQVCCRKPNCQLLPKLGNQDVITHCLQTPQLLGQESMRQQGRAPRLPSVHGMQTRRGQQGESPPSWQMIRAGKSENYNQQMQQQMGWKDPYQYYPERGLYYHEVKFATRVAAPVTNL